MKRIKLSDEFNTVTVKKGEIFSFDMETGSYERDIAWWPQLVNGTLGWYWKRAAQDQVEYAYSSSELKRGDRGLYWIQSEAFRAVREGEFEFDVRPIIAGDSDVKGEYCTDVPGAPVKLGNPVRRFKIVIKA